MKNTEVVDTTSKYIVKSTGIGSETDEELVNANDLTGQPNDDVDFTGTDTEPFEIDDDPVEEE